MPTKLKLKFFYKFFRAYNNTPRRALNKALVVLDGGKVRINESHPI